MKEAKKILTATRMVMTDTRRPLRGDLIKETISRTTTPKAGHILETGASSMKIFKDAGWKPKEGYQLRYIYFLDPTARDLLTVPILPFSEIERRGAAMYKGEKIKRAKQAIASFPDDSGGAAPTGTLQNEGIGP
ncbi:MAG: hypothetical protein FJ119_14600 [Deltaproteobacteria bacterium]|nr:hypothetical protein [Deltaproteobacteria bacterium]